MVLYLGMLTLQTAVSYSDRFMAGCAIHPLSSHSSSQNQRADLPVVSVWAARLLMAILLVVLPDMFGEGRSIAQPVTPGATPAKSSGGTPRPTLEHAKNLIETHQEGAAIATLKR